MIMPDRLAQTDRYHPVHAAGNVVVNRASPVRNARMIPAEALWRRNVAARDQSREFFNTIDGERTGGFGCAVLNG
jgi:hypothetical protein